MIKEARHILKKFFGYDTFRKGQEQIIKGILNGQDSFAIMPTGAGKSICYQVPALLFEGITIVISPLISLMQDQVKALNDAGIYAAYINSSLSETQISKAISYASQGKYKIIYVAPERLESYEFIHFATNANISMITVDEAHCISQWGQDFRPSYVKIVDFIRMLPNRPVVSAFTATATEDVKDDVICTLGLDNPNIVTTGFDRENLYYVVEHTTKKDEFIMDYVVKHSEESGIIYCATRKNVDTLYELLYANGISVGRYHAGLSNEERKRSQDDFIYDKTSIIIATNAFGMGIDKSNVRYVIHYNMPQSMENYYQEAGRAGRDGEASQCILLFSPQDIIIDKFLLDKKEFLDVNPEDIELIRQRDLARLHSMEYYCKTTGCLRNYILNYFGEKTGEPCDNCGNCHREYKEVDMTNEAKTIANCVYETRGRYGIMVVIGTLLGAKRAKLREIGATSYKTYGALSSCSESELRMLINHMIQEGYLYQTDDKYSVLRMGNEINKLLDKDAKIIVRTYEEKENESRKLKTARARSTDVLTTAGFDLFDELRALRLEIAREESMPPYIIFNDKTLIDMCAKLPGDKAGMLDVNGVGENKFSKYGQRFIDKIQEFVANHPGIVLSEAGNVLSDSGTINNNSISNSTINNSRVNSLQKKREKDKEEFYLTKEQADMFNYGELYHISEIRENLNILRDDEYVQKITNVRILSFLKDEGIIVDVKRGGMIFQTKTAKGDEMGIEAIPVVAKSGKTYETLKYPENVQRMVVEFFTEMKI